MSDIRNRLLSIQFDVEHHVKPVLNELPQYPVLANERCGTWYAPTSLCGSSSTRVKTCYFKSTDGHVGTWNFSLKRLNLPTINAIAKNGNGCIILDSSVRKKLPDSFSRTIPIWACVMNRIVARLRDDLKFPPLANWDTNLYTPGWLVPEDEHNTICCLLDERVEALYRSGAIVNPKILLETLIKPLRPYWVTPDGRKDVQVDPSCYAVVCLSCSSHSLRHTTFDFTYMPGAGDDDESWSRKLTPRLLWENFQCIIDAPNSADAIDSVVENAQVTEKGHSFDCCYDEIGDLGIFIGSRRAGRPPECWNTFDAVLAVTDVEYDEMKGPLPQGKYYLQLPVQEGKRDRFELERWMPVGIAFVALHKKKRVLIHCAQGKDRSVAIVMACLTLLCDLKSPIQFLPNMVHLSHYKLCSFAAVDFPLESCDEVYQRSGLSHCLIQALSGKRGRDYLLDWLKHELGSNQHDSVTKGSLRVTLHVVQQYREKASPSRATMQKLNRFFMSSQYC